jgi:predicted DNA-binding protein (MmcQ/YjbR family)
MHASQAIAHMRQVSLISACERHSVMHAVHIAMQASSMAIMLIGSMPTGRIMAFIIVMHMSAHIAHRLAQVAMPSMPDIASEHIVHACMQPVHASMHSCIIAMSIIGIVASSPVSMPAGIAAFIIAIVIVDSIVVSPSCVACGRRTTPVRGIVRGSRGSAPDVVDERARNRQNGGMDPDDLAAFLLDLNGSEESYPFGPETRVHKVAGKIFAFDRPDAPPADRSITLKALPEDVPRLIRSVDGIGPGYHMNKKHWVTVRLDGSVEEGHVRELIMESHAIIVAALPKEIRRGLEG